MVVGDITTGTDLAVIGAGPAGYVAAIRASQLDLDVTLIEKSAYGGACLNHGCIPSKAMLSATEVADRAREGEDMGVFADPAIDLSQMVSWKDRIVRRLTKGVEHLCETNGVNLIEGEATFVDSSTLRVTQEDEEAGAETFGFEQAIIATGSRPMTIPGFAVDEDPIIDSRQALALDRVPDTLAVVGGGYIGMELATVFAKAGSSVTVIEMLENILPGYDAALTKPVRSRAERLGIEFKLETTVEGWTRNGTEAIVETAGGETVTAEKVLIAVGREAVTDTLGLDNLGISLSADGTIPTDDQQRTELDHVFAIGDVAGEPMLAHKGMAEGLVAAAAAAGQSVAFDQQAIPAAVFTDPEIATAGYTPEEAEDAGFAVSVGTFPFAASGRAMTRKRTDGFVRLVADAEEGFILGGQIVGPEASELIAEITFAIEMGARLEDLARTIHTHPTLMEAVMEAAHVAEGQAIHTQNR